MRIRQDLHDFGTEVNADPPPAVQVGSFEEFQRGAAAGCAERFAQAAARCVPLRARGGTGPANSGGAIAR